MRQTKYCCVAQLHQQVSCDSNRCSCVLGPLVPILSVTLPRGVRELIEYICRINLLRNGPSMPEICFREHRLLFRFFFPHSAHPRYPKYLWVIQGYKWDKISNGLVFIVANFPKTQSKSKKGYMHTFLITNFYSLNILDFKQIRNYLLPWVTIIKE